MNWKEMLQKAVELGGSDIFVVPGSYASIKVNKRIVPLDETMLTAEMTERMVSEVYRFTHRNMGRLSSTKDDDFSFTIQQIGRFRVSAYQQRGMYAMVLRVVTFVIPDARKLHIPEAVLSLADINNGLVLVTGPAGSGKSTTLACIVDRINEKYEDHIITIEDPIEFVHEHKKSIVSQREINSDTDSYMTALRASLRQAPDVVMLGEMRDYDTIQTALTASETGHLVLSSLHTVGAANTIDRIVDVFPAAQQQQVRVQLSMVLRAVISQQLVPTKDGELIPVFEVMKVNPAISNLIRESKGHQIDNIMYSHQEEGMMTMDNSLFRLYQQDVITRQTALEFATSPQLLAKRM
ncbi:MAG: PilT/PilU family type 4a pilus ATPase [Erysipelotrichaceae bacterium]|nr:PilT/PilU family type 4a pilus ATPase [Erysipelotrichaceae bacterium]